MKLEVLSKENSQEFLSLLQLSLHRHETRPKVLDNMLVAAWSLYSWVSQRKEGLSVLYTKSQEEITSVSAAYFENAPTLPGTGYRICSRLWVSPVVRAQGLPSTHVVEGRKLAQESTADYVWVSFNTDRYGLVRRIRILQNGANSELRKTWADWKALSACTVNSVTQTVVYAPVISHRAS